MVFKFSVYLESGRPINQSNIRSLSTWQERPQHTSNQPNSINNKQNQENRQLASMADWRNRLEQITNKVKCQLFAKGVDNLEQLKDIFMVSNCFSVSGPAAIYVTTQ